MAKRRRLEYIILCRNKESARLLLSRYENVLDRLERKIIVDKMRMIIIYSDGVMRFMSHSEYYSTVRDGQHDVRVIGDKALDLSLDKFEERYFPDKKEAK